MPFAHEDTRYALGSVLNHVILHQTVIGLETKKLLEDCDYPDIIIACVGGGSNAGGMMMPFVEDKIKGKKKDLRLICVEPTGSPSITKGLLAFDYGDVAGMAPIAFMYPWGHDFVPAPIHAAACVITACLRLSVIW